jgi:hypothetical protein
MTVDLGNRCLAQARTYPDIGWSGYGLAEQQHNWALPGHGADFSWIDLGGAGLGTGFSTVELGHNTAGHDKFSPWLDQLNSIQFGLPRPWAAVPISR